MKNNKNEKLYEAIGMISDDVITESASEASVNNRKNRIFVRWIGAMAACFVVAGIWLFMPMSDGRLRIEHLMNRGNTSHEKPLFEGVDDRIRIIEVKDVEVSEDSFYRPMYSDGMFALSKGGVESSSYDGKEKFGFIDTDGKLRTSFEYQSADNRFSNFSEGLAPVTKGDKYGYIDKNGKTVIPFQYDGAGNFTNGAAAVGIGVKCDLIDRNGNSLLGFKARTIVDLNGGYFAVAVEEQKDYGFKYALFDYTGEQLTDYKYININSFSDGEDITAADAGGKWCLLNKKGEEILDLSQYRVASTYSCGRLFVDTFSDETQDSCSILMDENGKIYGYYTHAYSFESDYTSVMSMDGVMLVIDVDGNVVMEQDDGYSVYPVFWRRYGMYDKWTSVPGYESQDGNVPSTRECGFVDITARRYISVDCCSLNDIVGGISVAERYSCGDAMINCEYNERKLGVVDVEGNILVPFIFDEISNRFTDGYAMGIKDGKAYILQDLEIGKMPEPKKTETPQPHREDSAQSDNSYLDGRFTVTPVNADITASSRSYFSVGFAPVQNSDGKWGYINMLGELVIPFEYDDAGAFFGFESYTNKGDNNYLLYAAVAKDGKYGYIDTNGTVVVPLQYAGILSPEGVSYFTKSADGSHEIACAYMMLTDGTYTVVDFRGNDLGADVQTSPREAEPAPYLGENGKWGIKDVDGNLLIACEYDFIGCYGYNTTYAEKGGKKYLVKTYNQIVCDISQYKEVIEQINSWYKVLYKAPNGKDAVGFLNQDGELVVSGLDANGNPLWDDAYIQFSYPMGEYIVYTKGGLYGFADTVRWVVNSDERIYGTILAQPQFSFIHELFGGAAIVKDGDGKWGRYDWGDFSDYTSGKLTVFDFDITTPTHCGLAVGYKDGKHGIIDWSDGTAVIPFEYDNISMDGLGFTGNVIHGTNGKGGMSAFVTIGYKDGKAYIFSDSMMGQ